MTAVAGGEAPAQPGPLSPDVGEQAGSTPLFDEEGYSRIYPDDAPNPNAGEPIHVDPADPLGSAPASAETPANTGVTPPKAPVSRSRGAPPAPSGQHSDILPPLPLESLPTDSEVGTSSSPEKHQPLKKRIAALEDAFRQSPEGERIIERLALQLGAILDFQRMYNDRVGMAEDTKKDALQGIFEDRYRDYFGNKLPDEQKVRAKAVLDEQFEQLYNLLQQPSDSDHGVEEYLKLRGLQETRSVVRHLKVGGVALGMALGMALGVNISGDSSQQGTVGGVLATGVALAASVRALGMPTSLIFRTGSAYTQQRVLQARLRNPNSRAANPYARHEKQEAENNETSPQTNPAIDTLVDIGKTEDYADRLSQVRAWKKALDANEPGVFNGEEIQAFIQELRQDIIELHVRDISRLADMKGNLKERWRGGKSVGEMRASIGLLDALLTLEMEGSTREAAATVVCREYKAINDGMNERVRRGPLAKYGNYMTTGSRGIQALKSFGTGVGTSVAIKSVVVAAGGAVGLAGAPVTIAGISILVAVTAAQAGARNRAKRRHNGSTVTAEEFGGDLDAPTTGINSLDMAAAGKELLWRTLDNRVTSEKRERAGDRKEGRRAGRNKATYAAIGAGVVELIIPGAQALIHSDIVGQLKSVVVGTGHAESPGAPAPGAPEAAPRILAPEAEATDTDMLSGGTDGSAPPDAVPSAGAPPSALPTLDANPEPGATAATESASSSSGADTASTPSASPSSAGGESPTQAPVGRGVEAPQDIEPVAPAAEPAPPTTGAELPVVSGNAADLLSETAQQNGIDLQVGGGMGFLDIQQQAGLSDVQFGKLMEVVVRDMPDMTYTEPGDPWPRLYSGAILLSPAQLSEIQNATSNSFNLS